MRLHLGAVSAFLARLLCGLLMVGACAFGAEYLEPEDAFRVSASLADRHVLEVRFEIATEYHLYRERMFAEIERGTARLGPLELPRGKMEYDETFGKNVEVLRGHASMRMPLRDMSDDVRVRVEYQGCADRGLCYSPQSGWVTVASRNGSIAKVAWLADDGSGASSPPGSTSTASTSPSSGQASPDPTGDVGPAASVDRALASGSLLGVAGVFLVAGLLLSLTPCVLPMVPILSSIIVGQGGLPSRLRGFSLALAYALGMALVYTSFGIVAGLLGEGLAAALQNPWVLGAFALMLATMALSMFGLFAVQMPSGLQTRIAGFSQRLPGGRFAGVFAMGGLSALVVGPCVAAPLAGALVFIGRTQDVVIGGLALFCLAMGMSVPLLLVGVSAGSLLPRAGAWMEQVKRAFGILLLVVALWIVSPVLPASALLFVIGAGLLVSALFVRPAEAGSRPISGRKRAAQGIALVIALLGFFELAGALSGGKDPLRPLGHWAAGATGVASAQQALAFTPVRSAAELDAVLREASRPVLLDFYADWCVSCKEMERLTFDDPVIRPRLARAQLLRVDVTANSAEDRQLLKRFGLFGPPGILFFANGVERRESRVIGYMPPADFTAALRSAGL